MSSIVQQIVAGALAASGPEQVATVLGLLFVVLAMRESLWNFPVGLVQAAIFGWVCFEGKLYSETVLQALFFSAMIYGWWHWTHGGRDAQPLAVQRLSTRRRLAWTAGTLVLSANATGNDAKGHVVTEDLQVYVSQDGGKSWRYRSSIVKGGGRPEDKDNKGVWEPNVHVLDDGRLVAYYSTEQHKAEGYNQLLAHKVSDDGGRRWGKEVRDVAIPGGVQRPGMAIVTRLPDKRYAMTYENIDGPGNGQVFIKFSRDGLDWGDPQRHGEPVMTLSGFWPAACPVVRWFPLGGPEGVIVVSAERAGGGGDEGGRTLYWNNASGRGPWWEVRAPVQKLTGNIHAGWTQELLLRDDGSLLHVTSSSAPGAPTHASRNEILYRAATLQFNRYEAEDASFTGAVAVPDPKASNLRKARLGSGPQARLRFVVNSTGGTHALTVRYADMGLAAQPALVVNGARAATPRASDTPDGWHELTVQATLLPGFNTIDVDGGEHVLDVDYLQMDGQTPTGTP